MTEIVSICHLMLIYFTFKVQIMIFFTDCCCTQPVQIMFVGARYISFDSLQTRS